MRGINGGKLQIALMTRPCRDDPKGCVTDVGNSVKAVIAVIVEYTTSEPEMVECTPAATTNST